MRKLIHMSLNQDVFLILEKALEVKALAGGKTSVPLPIKLSLGGGYSARVIKVLPSRKTSMGLPCALHCQAGRLHSHKQIHGGETGEKEKQNGSCAVERGRKGERNEDVEG